MPATLLADDLRLDIDVYAGVAQLQLGLWEQGEASLNECCNCDGHREIDIIRLRRCSILGYGQLIRKRYDAALTWLERALALSELRDLTVYADALSNAGVCYARLGLFDRAIAAQRAGG